MSEKQRELNSPFGKINKERVIYKSISSLRSFNIKNSKSKAKLQKLWACNRVTNFSYKDNIIFYRGGCDVC